MPDETELRKVFVVDDESVIASTIALILRTQGFDASSYCVPEEARRAASLRVPDLLITDVMMPGLSGIDLAIQIQEQSPECKVLLFSGQAATRDLLENARATGHDFEVILKPVHPLVLLDRVHRALKGSPL